jgi:hypothetical protein
MQASALSYLYSPANWKGEKEKKKYFPCLSVNQIGVAAKYANQYTTAHIYFLEKKFD